MRQISESNDQVIYTTHDNFFVSVEHFDEIKLFRKNEGDNPKTVVYGFSLKELVAFYKAKYGIDIDKLSLKHKFSHIIDESKNEGFFAKKVVLIEGETEKYALPNYFNHKGFDLDNNRIALINTGSVDNISYLFVIFNEFHIPCYVIFDGDKPKGVEPETLKGDKKTDAKRKSSRNKELYSLLGKTSTEDTYFFPNTLIDDNHAVWLHDFESEFHETLDNYSTLKSEAKGLYSSDSKPLTARYISEKVTIDFPEKINPKIQELINMISDLKWNKSITE